MKRKKISFKACRKCNVICTSGIDLCPECGEKDFRELTDKEKNDGKIKIYYYEPMEGIILQAWGCNIFSD